MGTTLIENFSLDTLSRLKGIETFPEIHFLECDLSTLDTLSRLKGIETNPRARPVVKGRQHFGYTFPFEGN